MPYLLVQEFLKHNSFKALAERHGVYPSFSKDKKKFSLNYDQIESKESDLLAQQCRGIVLGINGSVVPDQHMDFVPGETNIIALPMFRFFNYGQGAAANVNFNDPNLAILEKLDGTLCIIYYDGYKWNVATRSVPEADLSMDGGMTFRTLFEKGLKNTSGQSFDEFTATLDNDLTYCFELTSPYNKVVVAYYETKITLIAVRNKLSFQEIDPINVNIGIPYAKSYKFSNVNDLIDWVASRNPMDHEGVIVRDSNFNRIKIKSPAYLAYARIKQSVGSSRRNILEVILQEKDDDVIPILAAEIAEDMIKLKNRLQKLIADYDGHYIAFKATADSINPGDKKTFAMQVSKCKGLWQAPFFLIFDGRVKNMRDFINSNKKDGTWGNSFLDKLLDIL